MSQENNEVEGNPFTPEGRLVLTPKTAREILRVVEMMSDEQEGYRIGIEYLPDGCLNDDGSRSRPGLYAYDDEYPEEGYTEISEGDSPIPEAHIRIREGGEADKLSINIEFIPFAKAQGPGHPCHQAAAEMLELFTQRCNPLLKMGRAGE